MTPSSLITIVATVVVAATGIALTLRGWPFNVGLTTVHKLASLAIIVIASIGIYRVTRGSGPDTATISALVATVVLGVADVATGAALTAKQDLPAALVWSHRIASWVTLAAALAAAWLLIG